MVTPMMTQLTYEGMIDDIFGINNGKVNIDAEVNPCLFASAALSDTLVHFKLIGGKGGSTGKTILPLNSNDTLFQEIRDLNFDVLVYLLYLTGKVTIFFQSTVFFRDHCFARNWAK